MNFRFDFLDSSEVWGVMAQDIFTYSHLYKLGVSLGIFIVFLALKNIFSRYIFKYLIRFCGNIRGNTTDYILRAFKAPVNNLIVLLGAYLAFKNYLPADFYGFLDNVFSTAVILFLTMGIYNLIGLFSANPDEVHIISNEKFDKVLVPFFAKILTFIVISMSFVIIFSKWGYDVNGFVAGLGLGGLAFAMAAKDLLANIFSGIVIITDKPFNVGDLIKVDSIEGIVEEINFRCTSIRGLDMSLAIIPNNNLINSPIINFSKREIRRITFNIQFKHNTQAVKIEKCITEIKNMLEEHPGVDKKTIFVKFDSFENNSFRLFLYFFTATAVWAEYLDIKQDTNFKILQILESEGVELAFPSSSIYIEK